MVGVVSIESRRLVHMVGACYRIDGDSPPTTLRAEMDLRDVDTEVVNIDGQRCVVRTARSIARESPRKRARQSGTDTVREDRF